VPLVIDLAKTKEQNPDSRSDSLSQLLERVIVAPQEVPLDRVAAYEANNFGSVVMRPMWHHAMVSVDFQVTHGASRRYRVSETAKCASMQL
jgi:hypothetical protein